jgi:Ca2+-transporting ATPase
MSQQGGQEPEVTGSPTEKAILSWGLKVQKDFLNLDPSYIVNFLLLLIMVGTFLQLGMKFNETRSKSSILHVFPFNSEKKRGGVAVHLVI